MLKEFKEFAMRGNLLDMAIGIIIGAAFGKIVTSFVNDVVMPPIGKLVGNMDFTNLFVILGEGQFKTIEEAKEAGVPTLNYGMFINTVIDFIIVALVVRKTAKIRIGLSPQWRRKRRRAMLIAWSTVLLSLASFVVGLALADRFPPAVGLILVSVPLFFGGIIYGLVGARMIVPTRITKTHVWLKGVCPEFLETLPPLP